MIGYLLCETHQKGKSKAKLFRAVGFNDVLEQGLLRDIYHDTVTSALQRDGWTITHDPFPLQIGKKRLSADLGAERLLNAEKGTQSIVVEVKSFVGQSDVKDLEQALG